MMRSASSAMDMAQTALDAFGHIDALVNNAALYGGLKGGRFDSISETDWDAAMTVNVKGIWNCCKAVVPAIRQARGGSIVNIASLVASRSDFLMTVLLVQWCQINVVMAAAAGTVTVR